MWHPVLLLVLLWTVRFLVICLSSLAFSVVATTVVCKVRVGPYFRRDVQRIVPAALAVLGLLEWIRSAAAQLDIAAHWHARDRMLVCVTVCVCVVTVQPRSLTVGVQPPSTPHWVAVCCGVGPEVGTVCAVSHGRDALS